MSFRIGSNKNMYVKHAVINVKTVGNRLLKIFPFMDFLEDSCYQEHI